MKRLAINCGRSHDCARGMDMVRFRVALLLVPLALVATQRPQMLFPAAVGVPEVNPVAALNVKGAGKPVTRKLVGEFVATIW